MEEPRKSVHNLHKVRVEVTEVHNSATKHSPAFVKYKYAVTRKDNGDKLREGFYQGVTFEEASHTALIMADGMDSVL